MPLSNFPLPGQPKPFKALLKVEKNRDGKTGKTNSYFGYYGSRFLTNEGYMDEFGEVMKILKRVGQLL